MAATTTTSRLDRLVNLLDSKSSSLRHQAALQIRDVARRKFPPRQPSALLRHRYAEEDWTDIISLVARVLPFVTSKSTETRLAAVDAINQIAEVTPVWYPEPPPLEADGDNKDGIVKQEEPAQVVAPVKFEPLDIQALILNDGKVLSSSVPPDLASELTPTSPPAKLDDSIATQSMLTSLGLQDPLLLDLTTTTTLLDPTPSTPSSPSHHPHSPESLLLAPDVLNPKPKSHKRIKRDPNDPTPRPKPGRKPTVHAPKEVVVEEAKAEDFGCDISGLSKRQLNLLKRKKKAGMGAAQLGVEANRMRVASAGDGSAPSTPPGPTGEEERPHTEPQNDSSTDPSVPVPRPGSSSSKLQPPATGKSEAIVIDPSAKIADTINKGGAIEAANVAKRKELDPAKGEWIWGGVVRHLQTYLRDDAWEARQGAAMLLAHILRVHGSTCGMVDALSASENEAQKEKALHELADSVLITLAMDRFGDFVGDQVMAPIREAASQTLGSVLKHISTSGAMHVHQALLGMVRQDWTAEVSGDDRTRKEKGYSWEMRHAGLLGLKYEVAVRPDVLTLAVPENGPDGDEKMEVDRKPVILLDQAIDLSILGLADLDDDVRAVAAACLLPIAPLVPQQLDTAQLQHILDVLWSCLRDGEDDLGSSFATVMELLGKLITTPEVIELYASDISEERSLNSLVPILYPFFRHTIAQVRLAVTKAFQTFLSVGKLPLGWFDSKVLRLLYQNLILEDKADIRQSTTETWTTATNLVRSDPSKYSSLYEDEWKNWMEIAMSLVVHPLPAKLFFRPTKSYSASSGPRHDIDKATMSGDLGLVTAQDVLRNRLSAVSALAQAAACPGLLANPLHVAEMYLRSTSGHQLFLSAAFIQAWADNLQRDHVALESQDGVDAAVSSLTGLIGKGFSGIYYELSANLQHMKGLCETALMGMALASGDKKRKHDSIEPTHSLDFVENSLKALDQGGLSAAEQLTGVKREEFAKVLEDRRILISASLLTYKMAVEEYDIQVLAATAGALVSLRRLPPRLGSVVTPLMNSVKQERHHRLQQRSATSVAMLIAYCVESQSTPLTNVANKILGNLASFLCADGDFSPVFDETSYLTNSIISLTPPVFPASSIKGQADGVGEDALEMTSPGITRRGAHLALRALVSQFGGQLFNSLPRLWDLMSGLLKRYFDSSAPSTNNATPPVDVPVEDVQPLIDCMTILRALASDLPSELHGHLSSVLGHLTTSLSSKFSLVRNTAARTFAAVCAVLTQPGMQVVLEVVIPLLGDAESVINRQGAIELIHHLVRELDIKVLPYVLFLVVPVLGRMSDSDDAVRLLSTNTFASLVRMIPLEEGIPDPPGFSEEMLAKRDSERKFLMQLLDGSKVEQYEIPVTIKADLRPYQKDGVSWLAFLAKYQLHGILCDDMGLGKSIQTICIVASKHEERRQAFERTGSLDSQRYPSLIVCPPTLVGHWYHEISKFTDGLRAIRYAGPTGERSKLRASLSQFDIVITSYEIVRSDNAFLGSMNWLYCVLDEGHMIKNAKTKLSQSVKQIKAHHRLILSGTPIQNNVLELWSLFDFLMPGFLGTEKHFNERFSKPILANRSGKATSKERDASTVALEALHKQVLPFLLRRLKEDVLDDLPPKIIQDYYCDLSRVQKYLYDDFSKSRAGAESGVAVRESPSEDGKQHVFQSLQYLRKLCNHPMLALNFDPVRMQNVIAQSWVVGEKRTLEDPFDIAHAPKLQALQQILLECGIGSKAVDTKTEAEDLSGTSHRVLIFCQLKQMLDIVERDLFAKHMPSVTYMRLDGSTEASKRHDLVQTFNADPSIDVLLLTTQVGGLGLNLTGADTVIFVDHDWNPMKDLQAMDRAHRIGQKKVVNVYRLIMRGTLEEKIMGLQAFKLNIAGTVVNQQNSGLATMNTDQVLDLFGVSEEGQAATQKIEGPLTQASILNGLEDLSPDDDYGTLSLDSYMSKLN